MINLIRFGRDRNIVSLIHLLLSFLVAAIAAGINVVSFPAILIENNTPDSLIGFASATELSFGFIASILLSRVVIRLGLLNFLALITLLYSSVVFLIYYYQNYLLWLVLEALIGICWISLYIIRQAWVNNIITDRNRSIVLALISSIFCLGFFFGSFLVKFIGANNHQSLITSALLILFSGTLLLLVKDSAPQKIDSDHIKFSSFFKILPNESLARFLLDLMAGSVMCLGVLFGTKIDLSAENAGLLIAAFMGSGIFDLYAGLLVKRYDGKKMIIFGFLGCLATMTIAALCYQIYPLLLASFFFFGTSCALIFIASLTNVNNSFKKSKLVAANATFQAFGSLGAVSGCLIGGIMIELFGYQGFFLTIFLAIILYFANFLISLKTKNVN